MKVLIVGGGGREHALAWKISQSPRVEKVFVAPGNAGTARDAVNVPIAATDKPALIEFAKENDIDLTVVGPEAPLVDGLVDDMEADGLQRLWPLQRRPLNWKGARSFARTCCTPPTSPRPATKPFAAATKRRVTSRIATANPMIRCTWSSKPTGWPRAKG